jgi:hypothetical protein
VQVFGLDLDQTTLFNEVSGNASGELGIAPGRLGGQRGGGRI